MKFGGSSVASPDRWPTIEAVVRERLEAGERPVVVQSALAGVTDRLARLPERARDGSHEEALAGIHRLHDELAAALELDAAALLAGERAELDRVVEGIALLGEVTPRVRARLLAFGERMATRLGAERLRSRGLPVTWVDARDLLVSVETERAGPAGWLSAECDPSLDPALVERLGAVDGIPLTQGFTACNAAGETVVLGRGGSDTAAAYLAGKLGATRLELWSDVPGMFTADPRVTPAARLLRRLDYREAQEIATSGSKVIHPRCIPAARDRGIPVHLRSTVDPALPGTVIAAEPEAGPAQVKAISAKRGVVLVSMETVGMWQEVGFLARATAAFAEVGLSLDLVSTSETNVTVSLDAEANLLDEALLESVVERLERFCKVRVIRPCAAVSMVGNRIRGLLHRLGPALEAFQEHRVHLVAQAASDLNLTVVVDEDQADRLSRQLHALLVSEPGPGDVFGPSWERLHLDEDAGRREPRWWEVRRDELLEILRDRPAAYVYDLATVDRQLRRLRDLEPVSRVFYAMKANAHPDVLRRVRAGGAGFECVSPGEMERVFRLFPELDPGDVLFTPNFAPREDYEAALARGVRVTLDALHPLAAWPGLFEGREILVRVDPGWGSGHHEKVVTGGQHSKFGVTGPELPELRERVEAVGATVVGLHTHAGSGILAPDHWQRVAALLARISDDFPDIRALNVGGGLGIPEKPGQEPLDLDAVAEGLASFRDHHPELELWMEPGRYVVAEAGVLLARVTQTKGKDEVAYVGLSTGMNSLLRPALYGSWHEIVNLTRLGEPAVGLAQVVGPICESGDRLGVDRPLPRTREGDVILIATAGAYGRAMASEYNLRPPAEEVVLGAAG
jgi:diaminopimelate decarboxylase/aspartate kinase